MSINTLFSYVQIEWIDQQYKYINFLFIRLFGAICTTLIP